MPPRRPASRGHLLAVRDRDKPLTAAPTKPPLPVDSWRGQSHQADPPDNPKGTDVTNSLSFTRHRLTAPRYARPAHTGHVLVGAWRSTLSRCQLVR